MAGAAERLRAVRGLPEARGEPDERGGSAGDFAEQLGAGAGALLRLRLGRQERRAVQRAPRGGVGRLEGHAPEEVSGRHEQGAAAGQGNLRIGDYPAGAVLGVSLGWELAAKPCAVEADV